MVALPIGVSIAIMLLAVLLAFWDARRVCRAVPRVTVETVLQHAPHLWAVLPLILLPILANLLFKWRDNLLWNLPVSLQYYMSGMHWAIATATFAFLPAFATTVAYTTGHAERHKLPFIGVVLLILVQYAQAMYTRPIAPLLRESVSADGVVLQTHGSSCCAASAANIVNLLGGHETERHMAEVLGTADGTSPAQVVYGMRKIGIECVLSRLDDRDPERLKPVAMLFVDHPATGYSSHAVVYAGRDQGRLEIWDPLVGKRLMTRGELLKIWHGHAVLCARAKG